MSAPRYHIHIERIGVHGIDAAGLDPVALQGLVEAAIARELRGVDLPSGRTMTAAVRIEAGTLPSGGPALAGTIARGVARGVGGGGRHG